MIRSQVLVALIWEHSHFHRFNGGYADAVIGSSGEQSELAHEWLDIDVETALAGVTSTEVRMWGLGVTQNFSTAATDLYAGYRHFNADVTCTDATTTVCSGGVAVGATGITHLLPTKGIDVIVMGARVLF